MIKQINNMRCRRKIDSTMSTFDVIQIMSNGNIGAFTTLMKLVKLEETLCLLHLDDMNIREDMIWYGFKDYCGQNMEKFINCIKDRSEDMINCINEYCEMSNHEHRAVEMGASAKHGG